MMGGVVLKHYYAGGTRVAMSDNGTLRFLFGDHLGSTSVTATSGGAWYAELRYRPWGEIRHTSGTTPTKYTFTGQFSHVSEFGLLYYGARFYDP